MKQKRGHDIVMLANGHPVFDTRIFVKEARTLVKAGYTVAIIIPAQEDEERDGVSILSVPLRQKGWQKLLISPFNILRKALKQPSPSVYCIHDSDILVVGIALKLLGRKVIYDAHEDTPLQITYQHWLPRLVRKPYAILYFLIEKIAGWTFDRIIVAEPVIARYFPEKKTRLVRNFPIAETFAGYQAAAYARRSTRLIHIGSLTAVRGLFEMLEAAQKASSKVQFEFLLGGKFSPSTLEQKVVSSYNVNFIGWASYHQMVGLLFDSRVGIIIPHPVERYKTNYPVKLFEFMAAGLPVIASRLGESAAFVEEAQCGILVDPLDIDQVADAIAWLISNPVEAGEMGRRGQQAILERYNWERESRVLLEVYNGLKPPA